MIDLDRNSKIILFCMLGVPIIIGACVGAWVGVNYSSESSEYDYEFTHDSEEEFSPFIVEDEQKTWFYVYYIEENNTRIITPIYEGIEELVRATNGSFETGYWIGVK